MDKMCHKHLKHCMELLIMIFCIEVKILIHIHESWRPPIVISLDMKIFNCNEVGSLCFTYQTGSSTEMPMDTMGHLSFITIHILIGSKDSHLSYFAFGTVSINIFIHIFQTSYFSQVITCPTKEGPWTLWVIFSFRYFI